MPPEGDRPGPHPGPPDDLAARPLPLSPVAAGARWARIHRAEYDPFFFGRTGDFRFDDPLREYGVLYVGSDVRGAFIETFGQRSAAANTVAFPRVLTTARLASRGLALVEFRRPLRLVDLTGPGLHAVGADGRLTTGDYRVAQQWSRALWAHPAQPDGILYRSRHDPEQTCAAFFERVHESAQVISLGRLDEPRTRHLIGPALEAYSYVVLDSGATVPGAE